jgi:hypothetical protein
VPTLQILSGKSSGESISFTDEAKVGKDATCQVTLSDAGISRFHAKISRAGGKLQIEDLGSSNGTYVNFKKRGQGEKVSLDDKDILFFGRTVAKFWVGAPTGGGGGGEAVSAELLKDTVPLKGLRCTKCNHDIETDLRPKVLEQELIEVLRRLRLNEVDDATLDKLLAAAK